MSNYYGQLPPQYNNRHVNNKLVNDYQRMMKNSVPFSGNQMLNNNPNFVHNINDTAFYQRMNMEKMEKMRKIKNIDELGISKEKLIDFVICPIKVEKENGKELTKKYNDKTTLYFNPKKKNTVSDALKKLWEGRQNNPYKNILKNAGRLTDDDYKKNFKNKNELIVDKITELDKNLIKTMAEYEEMIEFINIHNGALKVKYSDKKKDKYKEKFDYENKIKYRIKYDPKNYNELKKFYKKEQKKIKKANKRVDELIEILLVSESFTKDELEEITKPYEDEDDNTDITMVFEKGDIEFEKKLEKELEAELIAEFGEENLTQLIEKASGKSTKSRDKLKIKDHDKTQHKDSKDSNTDSHDENKIVSKPLITVKNKKQDQEISDKSIQSFEKNSQNQENQENKKRIVMRSKKNTDQNEEEKQIKQEKPIGQVDDDELAEFRKQKKQKKNQ